MKTLGKIIALVLLSSCTAGFGISSQQISADETAPRLVKRVEPVYPLMAKIARRSAASTVKTGQKE
jgi:hypothetical protein